MNIDLIMVGLIGVPTISIIVFGILCLIWRRLGERLFEALENEGWVIEKPISYDEWLFVLKMIFREEIKKLRS